MTHFFENEECAKVISEKCIKNLDAMWNDKGYFEKLHEFF